MTTAVIAFTRRGAALGRSLADALGGSLHVPARFAPEVGAEAYASLEGWTAWAWARADALVFVGAAGIAVRAIAPHVRDKFSDPAVVSVDEAGRFVVPLLSGHVGGANELARRVAALTGGQAAVSTATDVNGLFAVDVWARERGMAITDRVLAQEVSAALLEGRPVGFASDFGHPCPEGLTAGPAELGVWITDRTGEGPFPRTLRLVPRSLILGIGCRRGTPEAAIAAAADAALAGRDHRSQKGRGGPAGLLRPTGPAPDHLLRGGAGGGGGGLHPLRLCAGDHRGGQRMRAGGGRRRRADYRPQTGRQRRHRGGGEKGYAMKVTVIGLGPGGGADLTGRARAALEACDLIVGYTAYIDLVRADFPQKETLSTGMRREVDRCRAAVEAARTGRDVAVVCSGDSGVYGMAGLIYEVAQEYDPIEIEVVPGITAACGGAAVLGAPLTHDFAVVSLSDLLTPWEKIEKRLTAAAQADFVLCLYNPASRSRPDYLRRACDILLSAGKDPATVCGTVRNIGRAGEEAALLTLGELRDTQVDMFTTVFVGSSQTKVIGGKMVTPRGYLQRGE